MKETGLDFYKVLFEDLDPENLKTRFLELLLSMQNVERGSLWVRRGRKYVCIQSLGGAEDTDIITGATIGVGQPSIVGWVMEHGEMTVAEPDKDPRHYKGFEESMDLKSRRILCFPLILRSGDVYGAVQLIDTTPEGDRLNLDEKFLTGLKGIVDMGAVALSNALEHAEQLDRNLSLERTLEEIRGEVPIIGQSKPFLDVMKKVREYGRTDFPVLITGESGTGKDLVATALHNLSSRKDKPFFVQNCSAIPDTLLESELFGYRKGAFTGATEHKTGLLKAADGGTVFLDEIGDMSLDLQARILRVIQNQEIKPLGETKTKKINVRIISATNKNLSQAISEKAFREDLFYRINVLPLHLPPLRERKKDIPLLLTYFMKKEALRQGIPQKHISHEALQFLRESPWEGNVRELENFVKYTLSTVDHGTVGPDDIPDHFREQAIRERRSIDAVSPHEKPEAAAGDMVPEGPEAFLAGYTWEGLERAYVGYLLGKNKWNVSRAAAEAGLNRSTFDSRMRKLGIRKN